VRDRREQVRCTLLVLQPHPDLTLCGGPNLGPPPGHRTATVAGLESAGAGCCKFKLPWARFIPAPERLKLAYLCIAHDLAKRAATSLMVHRLPRQATAKLLMQNLG
jgi:hypothetical protein